MRVSVLALLLLLLLLLLLQGAQSFLSSLPAARSVSRALNTRRLARWRNIPEEGCESDEYVLTVLGDLHLDRKDMALHEEGRKHLIQHMHEMKKGMSPCSQSHVVSLGDLGAYGEAGTTQSFKLAKEYLDGFQVPYSLITGNVSKQGHHQFYDDILASTSRRSLRSTQASR